MKLEELPLDVPSMLIFKSLRNTVFSEVLKIRIPRLSHQSNSSEPGIYKALPVLNIIAITFSALVTDTDNKVPTVWYSSPASLKPKLNRNR
jgi:hypothetical protein